MLFYGLLIGSVYAAAVLDTALAPAWSVGAMRPDLLALTAIGAAFLGRKSSACMLAGAIGLFADLTAIGRIGAGIACFAIVGHVVMRLRPQLNVLPVWAKAIALAPAVAAAALGIGLTRKLSGEIDLGLLTIAMRCLGVGVYTAAIALPLLMLHHWAREPRWD